MAKIGVIGGGAFGTAMACVLARSGHAPLIWAREPEVAAWINQDGINPLFLSGIRLGLVKGAQAATFMGVSGIGDLMLTANSLQSRNTSLGVALGEGKRVADVLAARKEVTEGAFSTEAVAALARRLGVSMPITFALDEVINRGADLDAAMGRLMAALGAPDRIV